MKKAALVSALVAASAMATAQPLTAPAGIQQPPAAVSFRSSPLPGFEIAVHACMQCHSADYVAYQPPGMTKAQWTAEMGKMQHTYGAPIDDQQIAALGIYLASAYGDATSLTDEDRKERAPQVQEASGPVDAKAILGAQGCLGCHSLSVKIVGPAYHDVAAKYKSELQGIAILESSIRHGSVGKWGQVPMPAYPALSAEQVKVLAEFVLQQ